MVLQSCTWGKGSSGYVPKSWGSRVLPPAHEVAPNPSRESKRFLRRCNIRVRLLTLLNAATSLVAALVLLNPGKLMAGEVLRYDCSAQVYQAVENERLNAFTKKIGIPIQLKVFSSYAAVYRQENENADITSTVSRVNLFQQEPDFKETVFCKDPLATVSHPQCPVSNRIKPLAVLSTRSKKSPDELLIDEEVFEIVLRGAEQNQTVLFSAWYSSSSADINRIKIERMIVLDSVPALRALGYRDLCVQIYDKDQGQVDKYMRWAIDENTLINTVPFLEETCGIELLRIARKLGLKVWAIDPTYLYGKNWMLLFSHLMAGKIDGMLFKRLKRKIFNENPDAKVFCILAGPYISEAPELSAYPLGMRLNDFTNGRNFSVSIEGREYPNKKIVSDVKIHINGNTFYEAKEASPQPHQRD